MLVAFFLFAVAQVVSSTVGRTLPVGIGRTLLIFCPIVPFLLIIGAVVRYFRRVDEYMRLMILENWAMTLGITAVWTFAYGYLENIGFPRLSMFAIVTIMGMTSGFLFMIRRMVSR